MGRKKEMEVGEVDTRAFSALEVTLLLTIMWQIHYFTLQGKYFHIQQERQSGPLVFEIATSSPKAAHGQPLSEDSRDIICLWGFRFSWTLLHIHPRAGVKAWCCPCTLTSSLFNYSLRWILLFNIT